MKKILVLFCILFLGACTNKYTELGYSQKEANLIRSLSAKNQTFFSESYDEALASLLLEEDFKEENFDIYRLFIKYLDSNVTVSLVNDEILSFSNYGLFKRLYKVDGFDINKISDYLKKASVISNAEAIVFVVNDNIKANDKFIDELSKDSFFVASNLKLYLEHKDEKQDLRELVEYVNTYAYLKPYENGIYADPDKYGTEVLVNKYFYLGDTYVPNDLVKLTSEQGYGSLRKEAYDAYVKMFEAAKKDGIYFYATSSYRSYDSQVIIYNRYLTIDPQEKVDIYSARPGFSDHQTGYTVDILKQGYDFDNFYTTNESKWLAENAYKYGFILRYPEGLENATGYKYEPWHYRYIGKLAEDVYKSGVSYDEYFEKYIREKVVQ